MDRESILIVVIVVRGVWETGGRGEGIKKYKSVVTQ